MSVMSKLSLIRRPVCPYWPPSSTGAASWKTATCSLGRLPPRLAPVPTTLRSLQAGPIPRTSLNVASPVGVTIVNAVSIVTDALILLLFLLLLTPVLGKRAPHPCSSCSPSVFLLGLLARLGPLQFGTGLPGHPRRAPFAPLQQPSHGSAWPTGSPSPRLRRAGQHPHTVSQASYPSQLSRIRWQSWQPSGRYCPNAHRPLGSLPSGTGRARGRVPS